MHIPFQDDKNPNRWRCSNCGSAVAKVWNFCQHCGEMIDWKNKKECEMNNALKFEEVFGMNLIDLFSMKEYRYKTYLDWLNNEYVEQKLEKEKPQSEEKSVDIDYYMLGFEDLCNYVGTPVYVIYPERVKADVFGGELKKMKTPEIRCWEIVAGVKKTESHEYVLFRGAYDWIEIGNVKIYRNEDGANESA